MKWFKHDTDALRNRKIRKVVRTHGAMGYGIWWALLERLYEAENGFQAKADDLWFEDLAEDLKISDHRILIRVFDTFAEVGLISAQLWVEHTIHVPAITERGDAYIDRRLYEREKKRKQRTKTKQIPELSPGDKEGTKGQTPELSPADPDPDPDLDPDPEDLKTNTVGSAEKSGRVESGDSTVCGGNFPSDPGSNRQPASLSSQTESAATQVNPDRGESSAAAKKSREEKTALLQRFDECFWFRYPGTGTTAKGRKNLAVEKFMALLKAGVAEADIYAAFEWDLQRRQARWRRGEFCPSFPHASRYLQQAGFGELLEEWRAAERPGPQAVPRHQPDPGDGYPDPAPVPTDEEVAEFWQKFRAGEVPRWSTT